MVLDILWSVLWKHLWVHHLRVLFWIKVWTHTGIEVFPTLVKYVNIFAKVMSNSVVKSNVVFCLGIFIVIVVFILFERRLLFLAVYLGI